MCNGEKKWKRKLLRRTPVWSGSITRIASFPSKRQKALSRSPLPLPMSGLHTLLKSARADIACSKKPHSKQMILKGANMMNKLISYFGTFTPGGWWRGRCISIWVSDKPRLCRTRHFCGTCHCAPIPCTSQICDSSAGDLRPAVFRPNCHFQGNWHSCHFFRYKRFATFRYYCLMHVYALGWFDGYFSSALNFCFCGIVMLPPWLTVFYFTVSHRGNVIKFARKTLNHLWWWLSVFISAQGDI